MLDLDFRVVVHRAIKYLVEGLAVAAAAFYIPRKKMELQAIVMIAITAAASFAVLDLLAPSVGSSARHGAGWGIGTSLVGAPGLAGVPSLV
jgi:ABC-type Co2+ transport system permease subunit